MHPFTTLAKCKVAEPFAICDIRPPWHELVETFGNLLIHTQQLSGYQSAARQNTPRCLCTVFPHVNHNVAKCIAIFTVQGLPLRTILLVMKRLEPVRNVKSHARLPSVQPFSPCLLFLRRNTKAPTHHTRYCSAPPRPPPYSRRTWSAGPRGGTRHPCCSCGVSACCCSRHQPAGTARWSSTCRQ